VNQQWMVTEKVLKVVQIQTEIYLLVMLKEMARKMARKMAMERETAWRMESWLMLEEECSEVERSVGQARMRTTPYHTYHMCGERHTERDNRDMKNSS